MARRRPPLDQPHRRWEKVVAPGPPALSAHAWGWAGLLFAVVLSGTRANILVPVLGLKPLARGLALALFQAFRRR